MSRPWHGHDRPDNKFQALTGPWLQTIRATIKQVHWGNAIALQWRWTCREYFVHAIVVQHAIFASKFYSRPWIDEALTTNGVFVLSNCWDRAELWVNESQWQLFTSKYWMKESFFGASKFVNWELYLKIGHFCCWVGPISSVACVLLSISKYGQSHPH